MKKQVIMICAVIVLALFFTSCPAPGEGGSPYTVSIPKTGQTDSYATGDDGDLEQGVSWPSPRFTDNGNGTMTDRLTGLMWEQTPSTATMDWSDALDHAAAATAGGYADWRVPNANEMRSLMHFGYTSGNTYLQEQGFSATMTYDSWWTSSSPNVSLAWDFSTWGGRSITVDKTTTNRSVICVRGSSNSLAKTGQTASYGTGDDGGLQNGVAWPDPRFVDNGNGTTTDMLTGLMWQKSPSTTQEIWTDIFTEAAGITDGGYSDWRIPNIRELRSILNYGQGLQGTWLNSNGFENMQNETYWSSTTRANTTAGVYACDMNTGTVYYVTKTSSCYYIAVRDAD